MVHVKTVLLEPIPLNQDLIDASIVDVVVKRIQIILYVNNVILDFSPMRMKHANNVLLTTSPLKLVHVNAFLVVLDFKPMPIKLHVFNVLLVHTLLITLSVLLVLLVHSLEVQERPTVIYVHLVIKPTLPEQDVKFVNLVSSLLMV